MGRSGTKEKLIDLFGRLFTSCGPDQFMKDDPEEQLK